MPWPPLCLSLKFVEEPNWLHFARRRIGLWPIYKHVTPNGVNQVDFFNESDPIFRVASCDFVDRS